MIETEEYLCDITDDLSRLSDALLAAVYDRTGGADIRTERVAVVAGKKRTTLTVVLSWNQYFTRTRRNGDAH